MTRKARSRPYPGPRPLDDVGQEVYPDNVKFSQALAPNSPNAAREALGRRAPKTLACEILGLTQPEFSAAFKGSPMKRALRCAQDRLRCGGSSATRRQCWAT